MEVVASGQGEPVTPASISPDLGSCRQSPGWEWQAGCLSKNRGLVLPPTGHQEELGKRHGFWEQQPLAGTTLLNPLSTFPKCVSPERGARRTLFHC